MITIHFNEIEYYDEVLNRFYNLPAKVVNFEYSLASVAEWEAIWKIPLLNTELTLEDKKFLSLVECMSNDKELLEHYLDDDAKIKLYNYLTDSQTATTINTSQNGNTTGRGKVYTAEEIYALMFMNGIPIEWESRNINRLLLILRIISIYQNPPKKMSREDIMMQNARLNRERKAKYKTKG